MTMSTGDLHLKPGKDFRLQILKIMHERPCKKLEETPNENFKQAPITHMASYWNWMGKFSMVPFKLEWDPYHNQFIAISTKFQKTLCGIITICSLLILFYWLTKHYRLPDDVQDSRTTSESLLSIFKYFKSVVGLLKGVIFTNIIWRKKERVLKVVNLTQEHFRISPSHYQLYFSLLRVSLFASSLMHLMVIDDVKSIVKMPCECSQLSIVDCVQKFTRTHWIAGLAWVETTVITTTKFFFYSLVLNMRWAGIRYEEECFPTGGFWNDKKMLEKRISMYYAMKRLVRQSADLMGSFTFVLYLELLFYFANCLGMYADLKKDQLQFTLFVLNIGLTMIFWSMACEFHRKVNCTTYEWIQLYNEDGHLQITWEERGRLISLSNEVGTSPIGISCRFFSIGSMIGMIITYGILVLQMNPQQINDGMQIVNTSGNNVS